MRGKGLFCRCRASVVPRSLRSVLRRPEATGTLPGGGSWARQGVAVKLARVSTAKTAAVGSSLVTGRSPGLYGLCGSIASLGAVSSAATARFSEEEG